MVKSVGVGNIYDSSDTLVIDADANPEILWSLTYAAMYDIDIVTHLDACHYRPNSIVDASRPDMFHHRRRQLICIHQVQC